MSTAFHP